MTESDARLALSDDPSERARAAYLGFGLDRLSHDESWLVRREVAKHGVALKLLSRDKHWAVRLAVAQRGYALNRLRLDRNKDVRQMARAVLREQRSAPTP